MDIQENSDYLIPGEDMAHIVKVLKGIAVGKVPYNRDKLTMAEEAISDAQVNATMLLGKLKKIIGGCCEDGKDGV